MKLSRTTTVFVFALLTISFSCNKEIDLLEELVPVQPASADANAGSWRLIALSSPTQIAVPPPAAVTSEAYRAELAAIKDAQGKLATRQREIIAYWSAGGVLRWNQIMRGLVARFNLAPSPLADGTYPTPDPENPFGNPEFPFANPPYAARAYSYVSAAQYDALKAAWAYKFQYNRPTPTSVDGSIQALMPTSNLPAYPSEDAVISGVTAEMLKALFPAAVEEITLKAAEQRNAAIWAGKAAASDVAAGLALGKSVAAVFTARAASDGMRTAIGNKAQWKLLEDNTAARGEMPWKSLDAPARPPMLPFFGLRDIGGAPVGVRCWNLTNNELVGERPAAPPSTSSQEMRAALDEVKSYADNLTRERLAIVHKWADGAGTYTPPGHWNDIAAEYISGARMSEVRAARAFALLNMALHDAAVACWETKYFYYNPRPSQLNPAIKTATGVPNFPSFTSGHSTFSGAAAHVLSYLFPSDRSFFESQATEASLSRLYGGIHYRVDCEVGLQHGKRVAQYTINFAQQDGAN
jgi:hypothetical protein